ncbi:hypothetical protein GCM10023172_05570 [Hymenobacter ginsengisoli]|uniref:Uncharacterized protein n=1 Tax=Hymenobacter ginsengisoli TaxID=1051626 RepID=A0ABP8PYW2_9BACT
MPRKVKPPLQFWHGRPLLGQPGARHRRASLSRKKVVAPAANSSPGRGPSQKRLRVGKLAGAGPDGVAAGNGKMPAKKHHDAAATC